MGKRGSKPAAGNNIIPLGVVPVARPAPPARLRPHGRRAWEQTLAGLPTGHIEAASLPLLEAYCAAISLAAEATDELYGADPVQLVIRTPSGREVTNPLIGIIANATRSAASLSTKLRISRSSRPKDRGRSPAQSSGRAGLMFHDSPDAD